MVFALLIANVIAILPSAPEGSSVLGPLIGARGGVHDMNRTELQAELIDRAQAFNPADTDDDLRIRLYGARAAIRAA